ncbi:MAG: YeeE/YedE family protein [Geobacteraceae bacterium]|nr:YeeE/YedE family protein [Geobacteraceae bacterium]
MTAPLVPETISADYSLLIAVISGCGMGFFLERAGFGSAKKLVSQFYLHDMGVFKVMFTAIVTAMTGVFILSSTGFMPIENLAMVGTFLPSQIVGGLILGIGFVIGGYCPGTSAVASATGKIDGIVYMAGLVAGMLAFAAIYPTVEPFLNAGSMGQVTLYGYFGLPSWLVVVAVIVMAVGGFVGATALEKKFAHLKPEE